MLHIDFAKLVVIESNTKYILQNTFSNKKLKNCIIPKAIFKQKTATYPSLKN